MAEATGPSDATGEATHVPTHVAVIMDGNGRWAQARGLPRRSEEHTSELQSH